MIVILPLNTIVRILDHAKPTSSARARAALAKDIISALSKARKDKANLVGPLEPSQFNDLSAWCRNAGLIQEGETVEASVRASG